MINPVASQGCQEALAISMNSKHGCVGHSVHLRAASALVQTIGCMAVQRMSQRGMTYLPTTAPAAIGGARRVAQRGGLSRALRQQGSNQSSVRIQTHHSTATGTMTSASTARL